MNKETIAGVSTTVALAAGLAYLYNKNNMGASKNTTDLPEIFQDEKVGPLVKKMIGKYADQMTNPESIIKIVRQLDFWYSQGLEETELVEIVESLCEKATILTSGFNCPKVRFGKTELQMPIITCGGMRLQQTWMPDFMFPLAPRRSKVLKSPSQENLMNAVRWCLKVGINHFETARMYGTSEYQFAEALHIMMQSGEIKREDFIFQTKIPPKATRKEWEKMFEQSWAHCERLGYIDCVSMWCASNTEQTEWLLAEGEDTCMAAALEYKKQGKIKHIGFSTHGTAGNILQMINSERFEYVNLHAHFMGSYHAEGTMDGQGGHGNLYAVKRAKELDMGVFLISPIDKGGAMYCPTKALARTLGPKMTPIEFSLLTGWKSGHHTASVGFSQPADIEDSLFAAKMWTQEGCAGQLIAAEDRMKAQFEKELSKEWHEKGLLNLPTCEVEATQGTAIGHVLWLYNLMKAFGMYEFCSVRYNNLLKATKSWKKRASFEENTKKAWEPGNMGRSFVPEIDYTEALKNHYDPNAAKSNMRELHEWMKIKKDDVETRRAKGFDAAYDLRVWECFPGQEPDVNGVVLQNLSFGMLGCGGGPVKAMADFSTKLVNEVKTS